MKTTETLTEMDEQLQYFTKTINRLYWCMGICLGLALVGLSFLIYSFI